jgi:hypothetical protein
MAHLDLGRSLLNKVKSELAPVSKVERDAKMEGRRMTLVLQPDNKSSAKAHAPASGATSANPAAPAGQRLNVPARPVAAAAAPAPPATSPVGS